MIEPVEIREAELGELEVLLAELGKWKCAAKLGN